MPRHKEFDEEEALQGAMEIFWSRGYEATSIRDLVDHMGINRQSLYDTFGDKHALFLRALDRYQEIETRKLFEPLEKSRSVKRGLKLLFEGVVEGSICGEGRRGCLMGNAMSELAGRCKQTAAKTRRNMMAVERAFYTALLRGRKAGDLQVRDPRAVARFLCSSLQGLVLMSKANQDRRTLEDVVKVTLSVLD
jgi:TetR/AcrR family transcriptional repressor of nem operon